MISVSPSKIELAHAGILCTLFVLGALSMKLCSPHYHMIKANSVLLIFQIGACIDAVVLLLTAYRSVAPQYLLL